MIVLLKRSSNKKITTFKPNKKETKIGAKNCPMLIAQ